MGEVFRARDTKLQRDVAIKVLPAEVATDPDRLARFDREARAIASLNHPHIVAIHEVSAHEGQPFFATVRGQCVTSLYDNDMAFKVFGYPGSAWEKGGYITRGFQDLKWLPAPSLEASPKPYISG